MEKLAAFAKERPVATLAGAALAGALLGGLFFKSAGKLVFLGVASLVASELWKKEGSSDVRELLARVTGEG